MLRVDWQPGKAYILETATEATTKAEGGSQKLSVTQRTEMEVTPTANGGKQVQVTFAHLKGEMSGPGGEAKFDTDKPAESDPDLLQSLGKALGRSFLLIYDGKNGFVEAKGLEGLAEPSADGLKLSALADARATANLFRKSMEMGLPPIPVKSGDSWTADEVISFPKAGETHVKMSGKFVGEEELQNRKHARISFDGKLQTSKEGKAKQPGDFSISEDSKLSGLVFYDLERHVVTMSVSTTRLELIVEDQPISFEQKVTTKLAGLQDIRRAIPLEDDAALNKE